MKNHGFIKFPKRYLRWLATALAVAFFISSTVICYADHDKDGGDDLSGGFYRMCQNLTRLSENQKASMTRWKDDIIEFATKNFENIIINTEGDKDGNVVALTFDDGPDSSITPQIIDALVEYDVKATFFFVGSNIENNEDVVKKAYNHGFQVANHSYAHPHFTELSDDDVLSEINKTNALIENAIGEQPVYIRPPYGDLDERTMNLLGDMKIILWSIDTVDWASGVTASEIADYIIDNVQSGDIVLMHSSSGGLETLKAVPLIIDGLRAKDYSFCTVAELVGIDAYTGE